MNKPHDPDVTTDTPAAPTAGLIGAVDKAAGSLGTTDHAPGSAGIDGSHPGADADGLPAVPDHMPDQPDETDHMPDQLRDGHNLDDLGILPQDCQPPRPPSSFPTVPVEVGSGNSAPTVGVGEEGARVDSVPTALLESPKYHIIRVLGQGGMGAVYQAEHRLMGRPVAIKVIRPELMASHNAVQRFQREVRTAANLHHPNIVAAYDADQEGDLHFLAMEYVAGTSLGELVRRTGPLSPADACNYIRQAALGLQYAHEKGMVHRDIKPDNLMCTPSGQVKILDFGIARFAHRQAEETSAQPTQPIEGTITLAGAIMGTPDYMAPEQGTNSTTVDIRADIYSLGCTLYYLLTGQVPFPADTVMEKVQAHLRDVPKPVRKIRPKVSPAVAIIVQKMMTKNPADRYQTPGEVIAALDMLSVESAPPAPRKVSWLVGVLCAMGLFVLVSGLTGELRLTVLLFFGVLVVIGVWKWWRERTP